MTQQLTRAQILEYAISLEQRAVTLYTDLAASAPAGDLRKLFLEYAEEEMGHRKKLEEVLDGEPFPVLERGLETLQISEYATDISLGKSPSYQDILLFAMQQEKQAVRLYTDLAERVTEPGFKALFQSLAEEEAKHKLRFEIEYDEHVLTEN